MSAISTETTFFGLSETRFFGQYLRHFFVGWVERRPNPTSLLCGSLHPTYEWCFFILAKLLAGITGFLDLLF
jgi:hypothetical protein